MLWVKAGFVQKLMGICRFEKYLGVQNSSLVSLGPFENCYIQKVFFRLLLTGEWQDYECLRYQRRFGTEFHRGPTKSIYRPDI